MMEMQKQHIDVINKQKTEVNINGLQRNKTKSNLSHSNTIKSNVVSQSGLKYNDSSYITGDATTTNKHTTYVHSQINGTLLDTTAKMLGDKEQLKLGGITGQQQQLLAELQQNKKTIKNIMEK